jgi:hypothetical protein
MADGWHRIDFPRSRHANSARSQPYGLQAMPMLNGFFLRHTW